MRVCVYCQSEEVAYGQVRAMRLARAFSQKAEVVLLTSTPSERLGVVNEGYQETLLLPPIFLDHPFNKEERITALKKRRKVIHAAIEAPFDVLITEQFPFGKKGMKVEVLDLIARLRQRNPNIVVVCACHGFLSQVEKEKATTSALLNAHYDLLLMQSDRVLLPLEEALTQTLTLPIAYSGFFADAPQRAPKEKEIVIIGRGTRIYHIFLHALVRQAQRLPHYDWTIVTGYGAKPSHTDELLQLIRSLGLLNVRVIPFTTHITAMLGRASLACCWGDHPLVDCYLAQTYALSLAVPFDHAKWALLPQFETLGLAHHIKRSEFTPATLEPLIYQSLEVAYPAPLPTIEVDHGTVSVAAVQRLYNERK